MNIKNAPRPVLSMGVLVNFSKEGGAKHGRVTKDTKSTVQDGQDLLG